MQQHTDELFDSSKKIVEVNSKCSIGLNADIEAEGTF